MRSRFALYDRLTKGVQSHLLEDKLAKMSKEDVVKFLEKIAANEKLKRKVNVASDSDDFIAIGQEQGFDFSSKDLDEIIDELKKKPKFLGLMAEAALAIFSPAHDDYPATGVQPFYGDDNPEK